MYSVHVYINVHCTGTYIVHVCTCPFSPPPPPLPPPPPFTPLSPSLLSLFLFLFLFLFFFFSSSFSSSSSSSSSSSFSSSSFQIHGVDEETVTVVSSFLHLCPTNSLPLPSPSSTSSDQTDFPSLSLPLQRDLEQRSEVMPSSASLYNWSRAMAMTLSAFPEGMRH